MSLFIIEPDTNLQAGQLYEMRGQEFKHLSQVMRHKVGDQLELTDGKGSHFKAELKAVHKQHASVCILNKKNIPEPSAKFAIAMALLRNQERFEFFLEKATEMGVSDIYPIVTHRTVSRPEKKQLDKKTERWTKIVKSAAKQSGRVWFPIVNHPISYQEALQLNYNRKFIPYENSGNPMALPADLSSVLFCIGPEGGFTESEIEAAQIEGFQVCSFGEHILRAETAAIYACAMMHQKLVSQHEKKIK
jgi:16S rRNA (uracil1498-N3)-methyltransferase